MIGYSLLTENYSRVICWLKYNEKATVLQHFLNLKIGVNPCHFCSGIGIGIHWTGYFDSEAAHVRKLHSKAMNQHLPICSGVKSGNKCPLGEGLWKQRFQTKSKSAFKVCRFCENDSWLVIGHSRIDTSEVPYYKKVTIPNFQRWLWVEVKNLWPNWVVSTRFDEAMISKFLCHRPRLISHIVTDSAL